MNVKRNWKETLSAINSKYEEAGDNDDLYSVLKALEDLSSITIDKLFNDNGYEFDECSKQELLLLQSNIKKCISNMIVPYVTTMFCKDVEHMITFRNHNNRIQ